MSNHFHLFWQIIGEHKRADVQRDFLKYIANRYWRRWRSKNQYCWMNCWSMRRTEDTKCGNEIRWKFPCGQRKFEQKLNYIHHHPVKTGLCKLIFQRTVLWEQPKGLGVFNAPWRMSRRRADVLFVPWPSRFAYTQHQKRQGGRGLCNCGESMYKNKIGALHRQKCEWTLWKKAVTLMPYLNTCTP